MPLRFAKCGQERPRTGKDVTTQDYWHNISQLSYIYLTKHVITIFLPTLTSQNAVSFSRIFFTTPTQHSIEAKYSINECRRVCSNFEECFSSFVCNILMMMCFFNHFSKWTTKFTQACTHWLVREKFFLMQISQLLMYNVYNYEFTLWLRLQ